MVLELGATDINVTSTTDRRHLQKNDDAMLMLMLMFMMVTLMLTPMTRAGILLERPRKVRTKPLERPQAHAQPLERPEAANANASSPHRAIRGRGQIHWAPKPVNHV